MPVLNTKQDKGEIALKKSRPLIGIIAAEAEYVFFSNALNTIQKELFAANMDAAVFLVPDDVRQR